MLASNFNPSLSNPNAEWLDVAELSAQIISAPLIHLPHMLGQLRELEAHALARLCAGSRTMETARSEQLLDITEAAKRLDASEHYLYRHWKTLPFAQKYGWGLRFSANGIDEYIRRRDMSVRLARKARDP